MTPCITWNQFRHVVSYVVSSSHFDEEDALIRSPTGSESASATSFSSSSTSGSNSHRKTVLPDESSSPDAILVRPNIDRSPVSRSQINGVGSGRYTKNRGC